METTAIEALIRAGIEGSDVTVTGDGRHFEVLVVSDAFEGKSLIQRHRLVLDTVRAQIDSEELHALSIKAKTVAEAA